MPADPTPEAAPSRPPRRASRAATIGLGVLAIGVLVAGAIGSRPEHCPAPTPSWIGGWWFRADDPGGPIWDDVTRTKSDRWVFSLGPAPSSIGEEVTLSWTRPPGRLERLLGSLLRRTWTVHGSSATVVESVSEAGTTWLHALKSLQVLPSRDWCPPELIGTWDVTLPGIEDPVLARLLPDGTLSCGPEYVRDTGTWRARGPDVFLQGRSPVISAGSRTVPAPGCLEHVIHARLAPDGRSFSSKSVPGLHGRRR